MKKKVTILLVAALAATILAGCNQSASKPGYTKTENGVEIITEATAKKAAADKASLSLDDVQYTNVTIDDDNSEYDVVFYYEGYKYEVEIDALDGSIKSYDKEKVDDVLADNNNSVVDDSVATVPDVDVEAVAIGEEAALKAALEKAELADVAETELEYCRIELDKDDGRFEYDIDFGYNGVEYDVTVDAENGDILEFEVDDKNDDENAPVVAPENVIGEEAALKAALEKAELADVTEADLEYCKIKLDEDDGRFEYDIDFGYNGSEYDVTVDAENGAILEYEAEGKGFDKIDDDDDDDNKVVIDPETILTEDEVLKIALEHAKLTEADVEALRIKLDEDDGKVEYEVEFINGYNEFDYDIDAVTGEIRNFDREAEHCEAPEYSQPAADEFISENDAKDAAFAHAGVDAANAYEIEIELDKDNGKFVYELEFQSGNCEYEYDIDALTGEVIRANKEIDD